jgi:transcriptional regulator with XRE-family HTH domain
VETFGERLGRLRLARGLSRAQLAQRVGVTHGAISQLENGQSKCASLLIGLRLAKELGVDPFYLAIGVAGDADVVHAGGESIALRVSALERNIEALLNTGSTVSR